MDNVVKAEEYEKDSMNHMIKDPKDEKDLESQWTEYNDMHKKKRREADWKSIELYGKDNRQRYEELRSQYLKKDIPEPDPDTIEEMVLEQVDDSGDFSQIRYPRENGEKAKIWGLQNIRTIIYPVNDLGELERLWDDFNGMHRKNQRESDWKSLDLFGVDNKTHYEFLRSSLLKKDIDHPLEKENTLDGSEIMPEDDYEELSNHNGLFGYTESVDISLLEDTAIILPMVLPYYDDEEAMGLLSIYGDTPIPNDEFTKFDFSISEWKKQFKNFSEGYGEYDSTSWERVVHSISNDLEATRIKGQDTSYLEQCLLELRWNPSIPYNESTKMAGSIRFANKTKYIIEANIDDLPANAFIPSGLEPVYIVLVQGHAVFSKAIMKFTQGPFSHAALGLDHHLDKLYSYNIAEGMGFSIESMKRYSKDTYSTVYCIFVKPEDKLKIKEKVEWFVTHKDKTHYSFLNVAGFVAGVPIERQTDMICSQFVDSMLKSVDANVVNKPSPLVGPNDFMRAAKSNKRIYKLYEGKAGNYKPNKAVDKLNRIRAIARPVNEAKDVPVYFDDYGNLMIKNMSKLDYEAEYAACHKLLMAYDKAGNMDGMKYELSKLWFMNNLISKQIFAKNSKLSEEERSALLKARAKILNDFYKYLDVVQEQDKKFNFNRYYEDSPFSNAAYKIRASSIKYTIKTAKDLLL